MPTAGEVSVQMLKNQGPLGRCKFDEPVFVLRAQDALAADLVEKWAIWAQAGGTNSDKVKEAMDLADEMRRWPVRKHPD